jgi:nucleoside-diphosphate-sugar epimerase
MSEKPRVLILGGLGFIGKNLVRYLATNDLVSKICVSDKVLPQVAGLSEEEKVIFDNTELVAFKQANLAREDRAEVVFNHEGGNYQYVINLAGTTKYSQAQEIYQENIIDVARTCAGVAARLGNCQRFIEVSTAQIYKGKNMPDDGWAEDGTVDPWTGVATARFEAENAVRATAGLDYVIVRPCIVYGPGDILGLTPRLVIGSIYKESGKTMKLLWSKSLKMNTVHVEDVCRAIWHLTTHGSSGDVFNLADKNETDQGKVNELLGEIYTINTSFLGQTKSSLVSNIGMDTLTDTVNDKHLKPWGDLCKARGILDTPLTPYLDEELLYNSHTHINGSHIESTGFSYNHPTVTTDSLKAVINDFVAKGYFPQGLIE